MVLIQIATPGPSAQRPASPWNASWLTRHRLVLASNYSVRIVASLHTYCRFSLRILLFLSVCIVVSFRMYHHFISPHVYCHTSLCAYRHTSPCVSLYLSMCIIVSLCGYHRFFPHVL
ncbi:hypothetical protein BDP27DRAFT_1331758 [Rhodocollybia butyracea]|uniref:Uncharacterized protein n=1 Tax=Rhodocollybia butyracea TaxID=206335 RepID=A0A9P5PHV7_9AGAR|nr:hypothetical protein BDP27DRAFT_1331758 [Rhodocollybia butyracea]